MSTPSAVRECKKLSCRGKGSSDFSTNDNIARTGGKLAGIAASSLQYVGDESHQNRIVPWCARSIHISPQDGSIRHGNGNLLFNMNFIQRGRGIFGLHAFLLLSCSTASNAHLAFLSLINLNKVYAIRGSVRKIL